MLGNSSGQNLEQLYNQSTSHAQENNAKNCFSLLSDFIAQGGDPSGTGEGKYIGPVGI